MRRTSCFSSSTHRSLYNYNNYFAFAVLGSHIVPQEVYIALSVYSYQDSPVRPNYGLNQNVPAYDHDEAVNQQGLLKT